MAPLTILCRRLRSWRTGPIAHRLYREDATRATYVARLKQLLDTVWNEEELLSLADEMAAIVQQHALAKRRADAARDADRVRQFIPRAASGDFGRSRSRAAGLALAAGRSRHLLAGKGRV